MSIKYEICGVEVDRKTYEEMQSRKFKFSDGERGISAVEIRANSEEIRSGAPETWKEARNFYDSVRAELSKSTRKTVANSGRALRGFLDDLNDIRAEAFKERERLEAEFKNTEKSVNENSARYGFQYAQEAMIEAGRVLTSGLQNLEKDYREKVAAVRENLQERLGEIFDATPDKLDPSTLSLLNTGICTVDELGKLAEANKKNPVMLRIIQQHMETLAEDNKGDRAMAMRVRGMANRIGQQVQAKDGFIEAFDAMVEFASRVTRREYHAAEVFNGKWEKEEFPKGCESFESADIYAS